MGSEEEEELEGPDGESDLTGSNLLSFSKAATRHILKEIFGGGCCLVPLAVILLL